MSKNRPLRVGFDLDGVILYNPARNLVPIARFLKPFFFRSKSAKKFYFPQTKPEQIFWRLLHKTSIYMAPGIELIGELENNKLIEAFLITARYSFLKTDFYEWVKKVNRSRFFNECIYNSEDEQPHFFKERMIDELKLDVFVEDNWGIVQYLSNKYKESKKIFWISNQLDRAIPYPYKFYNLRDALEELKLI